MTTDIDSIRIASDGFEDEFEIDLEERVLSEQETGGGVRVKQKEDEDIVQYTVEGTAHTVTVRRILAMDGLKNPPIAGADGQRMSLLILEYNLVSEGVFKKVKTELRFSDLADTPAKDLAKPKVVALAPFDVPKKWNFTTEEEKVIKSLNFELSGGNFATATIAPSISKEVTRENHYFNKGFAQRLYSGEGAGYQVGIRWVLTQNPNVTEGMPPAFRIAVLVERSSDRPIRIAYRFECNTGWLDDAVNKVLRVFDSGLYRDAHITYRPCVQSRYYDDEASKSFAQKMNSHRENLACLYVTGDQLVGLAPVWGLEPVEKN